MPRICPRHPSVVHLLHFVSNILVCARSLVNALLQQFREPDRSCPRLNRKVEQAHLLIFIPLPSALFTLRHEHIIRNIL